MSELLLTPEQAAERLCVSVVTVKRWLRSGVLPATKIGKKGLLRMRECALDDYIRGREAHDKEVHLTNDRQPMAQRASVPWTNETFAEFEQVARHLAAQEWIFAKTMPENPHEYTLRKKWERDEDFAAVVEFIRRHGYRQKFEGRYYTQLDIDDHTYWTMGWPVSQTILINRKLLCQREEAIADGEL